MKKSLTIEVPADLESSLKIAGYNSERLSREARQLLAMTLFSNKALSLGQAARLAGMTLWEFIPFLGAKGIAVVEYDEEDIEKEIETAKWLLKRKKK